MRLTIDTRPKTEFKYWFAWYPIVVPRADGTSQLVWFEMIERRWIPDDNIESKGCWEYLT